MRGPDEIGMFVARLNAVGAPYMITGATAAIIYGQPRVTNDLDVVLALNDEHLPALVAAFPESEFYLPPESVIRTERARVLRGHFNVIHHETGYKADIYLVGQDPLHAWAMALRRSIEWAAGTPLWVAPPEYVIVRKLEYFREGQSQKHPADIRAILATTAVDRSSIARWLPRLGLEAVWTELGLGALI